MKNTEETFLNSGGHNKKFEGKEGEEAELIRYATVKNCVHGFIDSMVIKCAIKIGLFDAIHNHGCPISLLDLTTSLSGNLTALRRILRYLAHVGLININHKIITNSANGDDDGHVDDDDDDELYSLTVASTDYLREDSEKELAPCIRFILEEDVQSIFGGLEFCVIGGRESESESEVPTAIEWLKGTSFFEWASKDASLNKRFNLAMKSSARPIFVTVVACSAAFEGVKTLVDVGGGMGAAATAIVKAFPHIERCIVYDLQNVINNVSPSEDGNGVEYVAGDMFVSVPRADTILLARVLHDWCDSKALKILKKCREAITEDIGKLIIVDYVIDQADSDDMLQTKLHLDIIMMALSGGKERTEKEWRRLLFRAGFTNYRFTRIIAFEHVIEAYIN